MFVSLHWLVYRSIVDNHVVLCHLSSSLFIITSSQHFCLTDIHAVKHIVCQSVVVVSYQEPVTLNGTICVNFRLTLQKSSTLNTINVPSEGREQWAIIKYSILTNADIMACQAQNLKQLSSSFYNISLTDLHNLLSTGAKTLYFFETKTNNPPGCWCCHIHVLDQPGVINGAADTAG